MLRLLKLSLRNILALITAKIGAELPKIIVSAASDKLKLVNHPNIAKVVRIEAKIIFLAL